MIPEISVVVPVYNAEKHITACLDSLRKQSFKDFEVVIVDDGSTDVSKGMCEGFCSQDERFKCIGQENQGPDMARKYGVSNATGRYIMFVDADDYVSEDMLDVMYRQMEADDSDIICSQIKRVDENGKTWDGSEADPGIVTYSTVQEMMYAFFVTKKLHGTYYAKLIKREIIEDYPFIEDSVIGEDISAALYMFQKAKRVTVIPNRCYYYNWNPDSISHSGYTTRHKKSLYNYIKVRDEILKNRYLADDIICGYFAEFEMAVATAMSRNWTYDGEAATKLKEDIKSHWRLVKQNRTTSAFMKICMVIFMVSPKLFMAIYKVVYMITGR